MQTSVENFDFSIFFPLKLQYTTFYEEFMVHCKIYLFWNIFVKNKHIQIRVCCGQHHGVNIWFESDEYLMDILSDLNQKVAFIFFQT